MPSYFTTPETWKGGFFELLISPRTDSSEELWLLLDGLWSFASLNGCYLKRDVEPSLQLRRHARDGEVGKHLYGLATMPNKVIVACGSLASYHLGGEGIEPAQWVGFYLPLGALSTAYDVGAYPFGPTENVASWKVAVESFLAELGRWIFAKTSFEFALIGFEVAPRAALLKRIRVGDIPEDRLHGILWNDRGLLNWYPATRT
jgi:hypothetical protein